MSHDQGFPTITYRGESALAWGRQHGEEFRDGIKELAKIRRELMLAKNPSLKSKLEELSEAQWQASSAYAPVLMEEVQGLVDGSGLTKLDLVILNNYTDFRDIILPEEGCSTVHIQNTNHTLAGQTWDMHRSAKDFMCLIHVPATEHAPETLCLSLVGCLALMGINQHGLLVGVNNINTTNARAGILWPLYVRRLLREESVNSVRPLLEDAPVTSGHNYIVSDRAQGEHWEVTPHISERVGYVEAGKHGVSFHTNHCLGPKIQEHEDTTSSSSTTHVRWDLLKKLTPQVNDLEDFFGLLTSHDGHPKSICSHFQSGTQDPSFTCAGGIADLASIRGRFWRGCPHEDLNYKSVEFHLEAGHFILK